MFALLEHTAFILCDETFTRCCKHPCGGFGNLKKLTIVLAGVPGVCPTGAYSVHVMKLSKLLETCLRWFCKFKKINNLPPGVSSVVLHSYHDEILNKS